MLRMGFEAMCTQITWENQRDERKRFRKWIRAHNRSSERLPRRCLAPYHLIDACLPDHFPLAGGQEQHGWRHADLLALPASWEMDVGNTPQPINHHKSPERTGHTSFSSREESGAADFSSAQ